jgi:DUF4097 and DUF4098 domain-containing protein YvlB
MTGPVVLIVLGVLFLLGNMHVVPWPRLSSWFAHYWPVLLILWGIIKLVEYQRAKRENLPAPGIGAGGVVLLIFLILLGTTATHVAGVNWDELRDHIDLGDNDVDIPGFGKTFNFDDQLSQALPAGSTVKIVNDRGAVSISDSNDNEVHVTVRKKIRAEEQSQADQWNNGTKPQVTVSGNLITINANTTGAGDHPITTDLDIAIPRKAAVTIASKRGDVIVIGRDASVDINNQRGDVTAEDITGNLNLSLDRSSARVTNISGDVSIGGHANEVSLNDIKGFARLNGEFAESLKLSKIGKTVSFKTSRTDLEFAKLDGDLDLDQGDLRANNLAGPLRLLTRSKDISLENLLGDARVQNENGTVDVQVSGAGNVQIDNRQGDIKLTVPEKLGFKVDARSRGGEVESDFDSLKSDNEGSAGTLTGTIGNGAAHFVLNNEHGTIELRKTSDIPTPPTPPSPHAAPSPKAPKAPSNTMQPTEN